MKKILFSLVFIFVIGNLEAKIGLRVYPADIPIVCQKGTTYEGEITVVNISDREMKFVLIPYDLGVDGSGGLTTLPIGEGKHSATKWITFSPDSFTLPPSGEGKATYHIRVPDDVEVGGYYSAIYVDAPVKMGVHIGIVCKFFITIQGEMQKKAIVEGIEVYKKDEGVEIDVKYSNIGNIHFEPNIVAEIKNEKGETIKRLVNENSRPILPGSKVNHKFLWQQPPENGNYQTVVVFTYNSEDNPIVAVKAFSIE
ncbi:MAG: hypothetical protein HY769_02620 [Candidatus Stahlbacteria bacterium]|nr:hypothetical protein [Candidatus Stahlbacteria bacterium]